MVATDTPALDSQAEPLPPQAAENYNIFSRDFWFGQVDSRPVCAFRIAFGLLLLKDAVYHIFLARVFYSDDGVLPRAVILDGLVRDNRFSLMDALGLPWMAALFFVVWALVALGLILGYRTRLLSVVNFIMVLSIHDRNLYVLTGADTFMRVLSFWMMFIPLNGYYSLDAYLARQRGLPPPPRRIDAFPVRMIQIQVGVVYFFTGVIKLIGEAWRTGVAMYYVMQLDNWLLPPGLWLRSIAPDWLLAVITRLTVFGEMVFPVLVFSPIVQPLMRIIGLGQMALLHLAIAVTMNIPDFSWIMLISYLVLFEPGWIAAIERFIRQRLRRPLPADVPAVDVQAESVLVSTSTQNRRWPRVLTRVFLGAAMLTTIWWNIAGLDEYMETDDPPEWTVFEPLRNVFWYTGLWQNWAMFAPRPLQLNMWISIPGVFEDGQTIELRTGGPVTDNPIRALFGPEHRWVKYEERLNNERIDALFSAWASYYCREYNVVRALPEGSRLATLEIHLRFRRSHAPGQPENPYRTATLWRHWCYEEYAY